MMKYQFYTVTKSFRAGYGLDDDDEISIEKWDLVIVVGKDERDPENWLKGFVKIRDSQILENQKIGVFPSDRVELCKRSQICYIVQRYMSYWKETFQGFRMLS